METALRFRPASTVFRSVVIDARAAALVASWSVAGGGFRLIRVVYARSSIRSNEQSQNAKSNHEHARNVPLTLLSVRLVLVHPRCFNRTAAIAQPHVITVQPTAGARV